MTPSRLLFALLVVLVGNALATTIDPVADFLRRPPSYMREPKFFLGDRLLRLDLDLNNDGRLETLISLSRDRNGKQGNIWQVYEPGGDGYVNIGSMTFSSSGFYLGQIGEIGRYGLVTFWPGGAGEGTLGAYIFDGLSLREMQLGSIRRDSETRQLLGTDLLQKYTGQNAIRGDQIVKIIGVDELAQKYGIPVETKTYREFIEERFARQNPVAAQHMGLKTPASTPASSATPTAMPATSGTPESAATTARRPSRTLTVVAVGFLALIAIGIFVVTRRSGRRRS